MTAAALAAFLAPFLPQLVKAGEEVVTGVATKAGDAAADHARRLWAKLRPLVREQPAAEQAAVQVAAAPQDERWRTALELQLEVLLASDERLAGEVAELWAQAEAAGAVAAGERSVAVGGDVSASTIITGDGASVR